MEHLVSESIAHAVGIAGVITYLLAYGLLQAGMIGGNSYTYALLNMAAASMILISMIHAFNMASMLIQVSFVALSIFGMVRVAFLTRIARFDEHERAFYDTQVPSLEAHLARKLLNAGTWVIIPKGEQVAREGEALDQLTFIATGKADVVVQGRCIGHTGPQAFIGELSFLDETPATATVEVTEEAFAFVISASVLRRLIRRHTEIRTAMLASFSANTRKTLRVRTDEFIRQPPAV